jgi:hypothetical protein
MGSVDARPVNGKVGEILNFLSNGVKNGKRFRTECLNVRGFLFGFHMKALRSVIVMRLNESKSMIANKLLAAYGSGHHLYILTYTQKSIIKNYHYIYLKRGEKHDYRSNSNG